MELNHRKYIEGEIIRPVIQKLYKSLSFNRITYLNRVEIVLKKWSVEFNGTFSQSSSSPAEILLSPKYSNVQITLSIEVDGIPIAIKQFEFSQSLRQGSLLGGIFSVICFSTILPNGDVENFELFGQSIFVLLGG